MRRNRRILLVIAAVMAAGSQLTWAGPLDAEDRAKVGELDSKVDEQLDTTSEAVAGMDGLIAAAEFADAEVAVFVALTNAQLTLALEQMLLESCVTGCLHAPRVPAVPTSASSRCWTCANPRLMIRNEFGGYLENVLSLVQENIDAATVAGVDLDTATAQTDLDRALAAFGAGAAEEAFGVACQAFGTLACEAAVELGDAPALTRQRTPDTGFPGYGAER